MVRILLGLLLVWNSALSIQVYREWLVLASTIPSVTPTITASVTLLCEDALLRRRQAEQAMASPRGVGDGRQVGYYDNLPPGWRAFWDVPLAQLEKAEQDVRTYCSAP